MKTKYRIRAFYPNFYGDNLIAYVSLRILMYFNDAAVVSDVMGISSEPSVDDFKKRLRPGGQAGSLNVSGRRVYRDAIPSGLIWALVRRIVPQDGIHSFAEWLFLKSLRRGDIAYLWPGASLRLYRALKAKGFTIVTERINTLIANSKRILDDEYRALGLAVGHGLTAEAVTDELACMNLADYIFSPSPGVSQSILEAGISERKLLQSSYGLEECDLLSRPDRRSRERPITALFVGSICVRKGIHLLLAAWEKADLKARLVLVGRIMPDAKDILAEAVARCSSIQHIDFTDDLVPLYRDADFLILPSLEEGSPLVSYLALGAWLPLVVSPMGAGGIVENGKDGIVIDPHDQDDLVGAIKAMVNDDEMRCRMSEAAGIKAPGYTWQHVAHRRLAMLLSRLDSRGAAAAGQNKD